MILYSITVCQAEEILAITRAPDFMRTLLENRDVPFEELIPAALRRATAARPPAEQADFLLSAGRYLAHALGRDPVRLERMLHQIAPGYAAS
jgi:hypothetical protein